MGYRSGEYAAEWRLALATNDYDRTIRFEGLLMQSLTKTEGRVYDLCHNRRQMTAREIAAASNPSMRRENVHRVLEKLTVYGLIRKVGQRKTGKTTEDIYEVVVI
jgi:predicted HTH transcriptional regulator